MFMQANEPFSRVDQGTSPMTAGLLSGLAMGGMAAGYQGLGYLSYSGIDSKYEQGRNKMSSNFESDVKKDIKKTESKLNKSVKKHENLVQSQQTATQNAQKHAERSDAASTRAYDAHKRKHAQLPRTGDQMADFIDGVATEVKRTGSGALEKVHTMNMNRHQKKHSRLENQATEIGTKIQQAASTQETHRTHLNSLQTKLSGGFDGNFEGTKWSNEKLSGEKEAHRWHGNNVKKASMKSGAFALGGFVVGGGVQMAVNSLNNG